MKNKWYKYLGTTLSAIALVIGVPFLINECYKFNDGYLTMWGASDILSYYGTVLGAVVTIIALIYTILFTRRQLQRDSFLERSRTKWEQIDAVITQALIDISPLKLINMAKLDGSITDNLRTIVLGLQKYGLTAATSLNMVKCYIDPHDYEKIGWYIEELQKAIQQFRSIEEDLLNEYMTLHTLALKGDGHIPDDQLLKHLDRATEINKRIPPAHDGTYQNLLNMRRDVFNNIYANIDIKADQILKFGRKKHNRNSHPQAKQE